MKYEILFLLLMKGSEATWLRVVGWICKGWEFTQAVGGVTFGEERVLKDLGTGISECRRGGLDERTLDDREAFPAKNTMHS